jgi:hypothetical protein
VLIARTFGPGQRREWAQMAEALARSAYVHCQGWILDLRDITPAEQLSSPLGSQGNVWNTHKLDAWCRAVDELEDRTPAVLIDADTLIVRPLDPIWERPFDLAYTVKPQGARFPFNAGVIFLRVSKTTREFIRAWAQLNRQMLDDAQLLQQWRAKFGGVNQSSLAKLLHDGDHDLQIETLPCLEWNCEDSSWASYHPEITRIVHYKSELRAALFPRYQSERVVNGVLRPLVKAWRAHQVSA